MNSQPLSASKVRIVYLRSGKVSEGLILHPDNEHILYPLGTTIVVRHIITRTQHFLRGHDNDISVITVSKSGKYIASGQKTHQGFQVRTCFNTGRHYYLGLRHSAASIALEATQSYDPKSFILNRRTVPRITRRTG